MNIKDYLHLYLGAPVICTNADCHSDLEYKGMKRNVSALLLDKYSNGNWTLLLRPLSDMTEEECIKANSVSGDGAFDADEDIKAYYTRKAVFFEPQEFKYLLSIGIDLFGLIDAGLAINKTLNA